MRILSIAIFVLTFLFSCTNSIVGDGEISIQDRSINSFNQLHVSGSFELFINQGDQEELQLKMDNNLTAYISSKIKDSTLEIWSTENLKSNNPIQIYVTVNNINNITTSGAVEIETKGKLALDKLTITSSGATDVKMDIQTSKLELNTSGASETNLTGHTNQLSISLSGAGKLNTLQMETQQATVQISGAGEAKIAVKQQLNVQISGAGSVKYKGNPEVTKSISGVGTITQISS